MKTNTIKKLFLFFSIALLSLIHPKQANATHAAGADIGFCWVGPGVNDYRVTYTFYRNCGPNATTNLNAFPPLPAPFLFDVKYSTHSAIDQKSPEASVKSSAGRIPSNTSVIPGDRRHRHPTS